MALFLPTGKFSPLERLFRLLALVLVLGAVVWAFWMNTNRSIEEIQKRATVQDATGALSGEQKDFVQGFASSLRGKFGIDFKMAAGDGFELPELDSKTLFIGIRPGAREVVVEFPPLMAQALGPEYLGYLRTEHFQPFFDEGNWQLGLIMALTDIWDRLMSLEEGGTDAQ